MRPDENNNIQPPSSTNVAPASGVPEVIEPLRPDVGVNEAKSIVEEDGVLNVNHDSPVIEQQDLSASVQQSQPATFEQELVNVEPSNDTNTNQNVPIEVGTTPVPTAEAQPVVASQQPTSQMLVGNFDATANDGVVSPNVDLPAPKVNSIKDKISNLLRKKPKQLVLISLATLFFVSGLAFAWLNFGPGMADRAVASSMAKLVDDNYFEAIKVNLSIKEKDQNYSIYAKKKKKNDVYRSDFSFKYSLFNIEGSGIYDMKDKATYLRINGLKELASSFGLPIEQNNADKWIKLSQPEQTEAIGASLPVADSADPSQKCIEGLYNFAKTDEFKKEVLALYSGNKFAQIKRVGSEQVDGQKATKYSVTIDSQKLDSFGQSLGVNQKLNDHLKKIDSTCTLGDATSPNSTSNNDTKINNVYLWLNSKKQLVQMTAEITSGETISSLQLNMLAKSNLDYSIPTDTVSGLENLFGQNNPLSESIQL